MTRHVVTFVLAAVSCAGTVSAQTFSADLVTTTGNRAAVSRGRIAVAHDKVRLETPEFARAFFVIDGDRQAVWFVRPDQWVFMDAKQSSPLTQVFAPVDPDDACPRWRALEEIAGAVEHGAVWRCERVGDEVLDGRSTVRYRVIDARGRWNDRWVDRGLGFPVRFQTAQGRVTGIEHIVGGPQAASLFAIPAAFQKFDPLQLIERLKLSDVWVPPSR